ncbi:hypothetical protein EB796_008193 [Bugula neritina]|uniref:UPAR/Ly6 domain-containing protein n=1 Tax=Bugula neritina TaxID=10212 RepID=A0A7J7K6E5_BUGNE|nr:hypothetical protein EB796_008193 [Bugula neritina]
MMNRMVLFLLLLGIFAASHGLDCYTCSSGPECNDEYMMPDIHLTNCSAEDKGCSKKKATASSGGITAASVRKATVSYLLLLTATDSS